MKHAILIIGLFLASTAVLLFIGQRLMTTQEVSTTYYNQYVIFENDVRVNAEVASTPAKKSLGLGGRASLLEGEGMLFPYDPPSVERFWMKGMLIPIDIIWLAEGKIIGVEAAVPPPVSATATLPLYTSPGPVEYVLEVPSGFAEENGLILGTKYEIK